MKIIRYAIIMAVLSMILSCHKDTTGNTNTMPTFPGEPASGTSDRVRMRVDSSTDGSHKEVKHASYTYDSQGRLLSETLAVLFYGPSPQATTDTIITIYTYGSGSVTIADNTGNSNQYALLPGGQLAAGPYGARYTYDSDGYLLSDSSGNSSHRYTIANGNRVRDAYYVNNSQFQNTAYTFLSQRDNRETGMQIYGKPNTNLIDEETMTGAGPATFKHQYIFDGQGRVYWERASSITTSRYIYY